jgi:hypothetical protein
MQKGILKSTIGRRMAQHKTNNKEWKKIEE